MSQHVRQAHPGRLAEDNIGPSRNRFWSPEELAELARLELELTDLIPRSAMVRELAARMPGRGLESIKRVRNRQPYQNALAAARADPPPQLPPQRERPQPVSEHIIQERLDAAIGRGVAAVAAMNLAIHDRLIEAANEVRMGANPHDLLEEWYTGLCPPQQPVRCRGGLPPRLAPREARREQYRRYQELWRTDRRALAQDVMGAGRGARAHTNEQLSRFWGEQWAAPSAPWDHNIPVRAPDDGDMLSVWDEVTPRDLAKSEPGRTACGPDGMTASAWKEVPRKVRALFFNVVMRSGSMPPLLLKARTTLLPKTERPRTEAEYRPITVASVAVRQLHRILAFRLDAVVRHARPQRGLIRHTDGIGANVVALNDILREARAKRKEIRLAIVDVEKAFDRVSHQAIMNIMAGRNWPPCVVRYVESVYADGVTSIGGGPELRIARGIRQGDPLSSVLFNIVMDHVLMALPERIGFVHEGVRINALAFADDVVLVASSDPGIRTLADNFAKALTEVGLNVNHNKSMYISLVRRADRLVVPREGAQLSMGGRELVAGGPGVSWTYLGIPFGLTGTLPVSPREVTESFRRLTNAPLKPLQKVELLRTHVIPSFVHRLVLSATPKKSLVLIDRRARELVRQWLRLPGDSVSAYIHGPTGDGGLGVMCLERTIPALRTNRTAKARTEVWGAEGHADGSTAAQRRVQAALRLHATTDGAELVGTRRSWASSMWLREGDAFTRGWRGLSMVRVHSGSLPSRVRVSRGRRRNLPTACRAGCAVMETAAHAVQVCPVTRTARVGRHNHACNLLATYAAKKRWRVFQEPHFRLGGRGFRPDLIVKNHVGTFVLDLSVCTGSSARPIERVSQEKLEKYAGALVRGAVAELAECSPDAVRVLPVTVTWKGVWDPASVRGLVDIGYPRFLINWLTGGVVAGSAMVWSAFMKEVRARRRGRPPRQLE